MITNEMHDLSSHKVPRCTFPIAAIDNVENICQDTVCLPKNRKGALKLFFSNSDSDWKFWWGHFRKKTRLATMFVIKLEIIAHINKKLNSKCLDNGNWMTYCGCLLVSVFVKLIKLIGKQFFFIYNYALQDLY